MTRTRRTSNLVRKQILEGISEYGEWKTEMAAAAENRRREEARKRNQARCGTVCHDFPMAWSAKILDLPPVMVPRRNAAAATMLN